jgi:hypothetical protein
MVINHAYIFKRFYGLPVIDLEGGHGGHGEKRRTRRKEKDDKEAGKKGWNEGVR